MGLMGTSLGSRWGWSVGACEFICHHTVDCGWPTRASFRQLVKEGNPVAFSIHVFIGCCGAVFLRFGSGAAREEVRTDWPQEEEEEEEGDEEETAAEKEENEE